MTGQHHWAFLTAHGAVFVYLVGHRDATIRNIADDLDLAERTVVGVLRDLRDEGYILVQREGRHNAYRLDPSLPMKRPEHADRTMREFFSYMHSALRQTLRADG